jgi:CheY-like chemotaxis protein
MDPPARIVIVEDEAITAVHLATRLRRLGYEVVAQARSGPQAIQQALALHPHVVLMDIHVRGPMDGVDAARHIQAAAPIPVVYMSAQADAATLKRLQATTQAAGFVPKPIHLPTLHATLQRVCARPHGALHRETHPRDPSACGMTTMNPVRVGMLIAFNKPPAGSADSRSPSSHGRETP